MEGANSYIGNLATIATQDGSQAHSIFGIPGFCETPVFEPLDLGSPLEDAKILFRNETDDHVEIELKLSSAEFTEGMLIPLGPRSSVDHTFDSEVKNLTIGRFSTPQLNANFLPGNLQIQEGTVSTFLWESKDGAFNLSVYSSPLEKE
jgi:hypothetical protein